VCDRAGRFEETCQQFGNKFLKQAKSLQASLDALSPLPIQRMFENSVKS